LIFAGIVAAIPSHVGAIYNTLFVQEDQLFLGILKAVGILLVVILVVIGVIYIQQGVRRIPVQYTKRVVGRKMYGGQSTHIPMKINAAGVIPVIFALALLMFPVTIASFWQGHPVADWIQANFTYTHFGLGMVLYVILIIGFSYFYTFVQINPIQLADQMKKNGGFIPGIRPGKNTSTYLTKVMNRLTLTGSVFLAAVSILPIFFINFSGLPSTVQIGGTSLLIVVGVALETMKTIESQLIRRHYKGFMHK
jgi:preprotein translocase subunit SecY